MNKLSLTAKQIANIRDHLGSNDEDQDLRADMIEGETDAFELLSWFLVKRQEEIAQEAAMKSLAQKYTDRAKAAKARADRLRDTIIFLAEQTGLDKIQRPEGTISKKAVPPKLIVTDLELFAKNHPDLVETTIKPKLKEAAAAKAEGAVLHGASMDNGGSTWAVR